MRLPTLPSAQRLAALCLVALLALLPRLPAQSVPYLFEPTAPAPSMRLSWQTEPGHRYDLFQSTDLQLWTHVPGFPATASGLSLQHPFNIGPRGFFRIVPIDDQPPAIAEQFPADAGFAVSRFADIAVRLTDATGIDPASIRLTVGGSGPLALGAPGLTFADGTLTYDSGATPLGAYGATVTATVLATDTLGHTLTHTWSFKLEPVPVVAGDIFVFGAAPPPPSAWSIESVAADRIVIDYTGTAPAFTVGQKLCHSAPTKVQEIFYRRVLSVSDNPATSRLTVFTEDLPLTDFVQAGGTAFSASSTVYSVGPDGTLVPAPPFSVSGTHSFPRIGLDLSGSQIRLGSGGDFDATVLGVTYSQGSSSRWLDVTATELSWFFTPRVQLALEIGFGGLKKFETIASGDLALRQAIEASVTALGLSSKTTIWQLAGPLRPRYVIVLGAIGPVPVYADLLFTFSIETEAKAEAVLDLAFAYRQEVSASFGLTYDDDDGFRWPTSFQASAPDLSGDVDLAGRFSLEVTLVPRIEVLIYSAAGFSAAIEPRGEVEVQAGTGGLDGKLTAGVDFTLAPAGPLLDPLLPDDWELSFPIWEGEWPLVPQVLAFSTHPQSRTVAPGSSVSFTCAVDSSSPASFQWFHNGSRIPGQTNRTLFLPYVTSGHAGTYFVRATAGPDTADSNPATLTVQTPTPTTLDTDGDGLPDVAETNTGVWISTSNTGTHPTKWDTDGDGLRDGVETNSRVFVSATNTGTDPNDADTDNDGVNDKAEIDAGTDPNHPPAPLGMMLIPAGSFAMGNSTNASEGANDELPVHTVFVSAFYMDRYEVTKALWDEVRAWGQNNGYTDLPIGSHDGTTNLSKGANHPVHLVSWYDAVKWCNARSEWDGLVPTYYTNDAQTVIYRTGSVNVTNAQVKWSGTGYRLPTEAEWEKAARGGLNGQRFPWGATITHAQANYFSSATNPEDISPTRGYHPDFAVNGTPYTSPAGSFTPNAHGLYDMAGNVWEWCWDWIGASYYSISPSVDPLGPNSGTRRTIRGSSWYPYDAYDCRTSNRRSIEPISPTDFIGIRCIRR
jgi:formylglycine-generating enzyme required for sulfatase activity